MPAALTNVIRSIARKADVTDAILLHYRNRGAIPLKKLPAEMPSVLSTVTMGLGDTMMLTDLPRAAEQQRKKLTCFSGSPHFLPLMSFNPHWRQHADKAFVVNAPDMVRQYDCGNGHYLQRIRRAFGLKVDDTPRGCLKWRGLRYNNLVILHFEPGLHALWQRKAVHPRARLLYPETKLELEKFIAERKDLRFLQVGKEDLAIAGAKYFKTIGTVELVKEIAQASFFIGLMSGPLHVATALELKCVAIINFPAAETIFLPTLKVTGQIESEWFAPQNVHLHQDSESPLVPRANCINLHRAFEGEIYPFWSKNYLSLIHEKL